MNIRAKAILLLLFAALPLSAAEIVEGIVARVGDRIITRSQYEARYENARREIAAIFTGSEQEQRLETMKANLLDEMIGELLVRDRADQLELTVTDAEVQEAIDRLKQQYGIESDEQFEESLRQSGLSRAQMETRLRETLLGNKLFGMELRSRAQLSDRDLKARYERDKEQYRLPERARVREIVVLFPEDANPEDRTTLAARAEEAFVRAAGGEDFSALVEEYSDSPSKASGGELGIVGRNELNPALDSGVFRSDAGAVVGPIETRFGYHILFVEERLASEIPSFDQIKERLRAEESDASFQRDLENYLAQLRENTLVVVNAGLLP